LLSVLVVQVQHLSQAKVLTVQTLCFPRSHLLEVAVGAAIKAKLVVLVVLAAAALIPGRVRWALLLKVLEVVTLPETGVVAAVARVK
jgi:hypothetical protein